ncbi:MAG: cobalamin biosynthesis protein CbiD, partial [Candidatus Syntrophonatronum acetioxidans]
MGSHRLPDGRVLRRGYTTGTCAAAAARAALTMLVKGKPVEYVTLSTPAGKDLRLKVLDSRLNREYVLCAIKKEGGDDPDITNGVKVYARVEYTLQEGIQLEGGEGVGQVTRPGLSLPVGSSAINPGPRQQIKEALQDLMPSGKGIKVTLSIPGGEELAEKTLNSTLGIQGGLSILGTTGIVEPMSEEAIQKSLVLQIPQSLEEGFTSLVLTPGRRGKRQAEEILGLPGGAVLQMSNFVGFMLSSCLKYGVREVILCGSLGKLVKVAGGIFNTHSREADARREIMAAFTALEGAPRELIEEIMGGVTVEGAVEKVKEAGLERVFNSVAKASSRRAEDYLKKKIKVGTILLNYEGKVLGA